MGICSSCLGRRRALSTDETDTRLLFEDPHTLNYGSFGDHTVAALQADPQDVQHEAEALQKIVAQTSHHLVDIFVMVPQNIERSPSSFPGQDARLLQYQDLLANLSTSDCTEPYVDSVPGNISQRADDWPSDDDEDEDILKGCTIIKPEKIGPLLGGFSEIGMALK